MKPIPGFPGYHINLKGEVWSEKSNRFLTTFVRPPKLGELGRHLNDINTDNKLENLAWGTNKQNMADMIRNGHSHIGEKHGRSKLFPLDVLNILWSISEKKYTHTKLAKMYTVHATTVADISHGRIWKHIYNIFVGT